MEKNQPIGESSFQLFVETIESHAIFMMDPAGKILTWNRGAQRLKGYTAEEIVGKNFSTFYSPELVTLGHCEYELREASRHGRYQEEGWRIRKDGTQFWASVTISAITNTGGQLIGFGKVVQDLTESKYTQDAIRAANAALEQRVAERTRELEEQREELLRSNSDLEQFASIASHDLQEPLRTITSYLQLLQQSIGSTIPKEALEHLSFAVNGSLRMRNLIEDLLTYARIQNVKNLFTIVDFSLALADAQAALKQKLLESGAQLSSSQLPSLPADNSQVVRLFLNLVGNALKYRSPERQIQIHVGAQESADHWTFSVADNGMGIPPYSGDKIFEVFSRIDRPANGEPGTGMGLAICKRIVTKHGGKIWFQPNPHHGATFCFTIPKRHAPR